MKPTKEQYETYAKEFIEEFEKIIYSHPHLDKYQKNTIRYHVSEGVSKGVMRAYDEIDFFKGW